jgi:TetR/AcrR family transcriptional regulator, cholesterol catabolism regulator
MTTTERIIEQATNLFIRSGIKAITMDDISREAGVSKRTIYENFKDKDDLLRTCLDDMDKKFSAERERIIEASENIIHSVFGMMKHGIQVMQQVNPLFLEDLKRHHLKVWKEVYRVNSEFQRTQTLKILRKGINQGLIRQGVNVEIVSTLLMQQLRYMHDKQIFPEEKFPRQLVFENVMINFFRGIATKKGLEMIDQYLESESGFFLTTHDE